MHRHSFLSQLSDLSPRFIRFCLVGVINTIVDFSVFAGTYFLTSSIIVSNIAAFTTAVGCSYILNRYWTFQDGEKRNLKHFALFYGALTVTLVINTGIIIFLSQYIDVLWGKIIATVLTTKMNFMLSLWLFKKR